MKKRLAAVVALLLVMTFLVSAALAAETGDQPVTTQASGNEDKQQEYKEANVVLDFYCLAIMDNGKYVLTDAFKDLNIEETEEEKAITDPEERSKAVGKRIAQDAIKIIIADGSTAVPAYPAQELDKKIEDMPIGMYLCVPHGSDLEMADYIKKIKDADKNEVYVSIAQTEIYEYQFLPILAATDYEHPDIEFEVKAERKGRYGDVEIVKTLQSYETSEEVTFGFKIVAKDKDGNTVFEDVAGLTFNGPGRDRVVVKKIPADTVVTVEEVYSGSAYAQISPNPEPVTVEAGKTKTILIGGEGSGNEDSFINDYDDEEEHGHGVINKFEYDSERDSDPWKWYKNGVLQN